MFFLLELSYPLEMHGLDQYVNDNKLQGCIFVLLDT